MQERADKMYPVFLCNALYLNLTLKSILESGTVSVPFIKMTLDMMRSFCENTLNCKFYNNTIKMKCSYKNDEFSYHIEPDATAASYFMTLPQVVGGTLDSRMKEKMLQNIAYFQVLNALGAYIAFDESGVISSQGGL